MKNKISFKQVLAIICIVLLVGLYLSTLVFALIKSPWAQTMLKLSLLGTIGIPVVIYFILMFYRLSKRDSKPENKIYADDDKDPFKEEDFKDNEQ